jgi:hypothetical protein
VLDRLALVGFRRFAIWYLLPRQNYFELIPSRSNNLQTVRGILGLLLEHLTEQTGLFMGLNVFDGLVNCQIQRSVRDTPIAVIQLAGFL